MIQIYSPGNNNYTNNGNMTLMPESASVHIVLGGSWSASLVHPIDPDGRWKYIVEEAVIKMPSYNGDQLFRIRKTHKDDYEITADMDPIFYDCRNDRYISSLEISEKTGTQALALLCPGSDGKYTASTNITSQKSMTLENSNLLAGISEFIAHWGGEPVYDNFSVTINDATGADNGMEIRYGKNLPENGMTVDMDMSGVVTRIYPSAYNEWKYTGDPAYIDSPLANQYAVTYTAARTYENVKEFDDATVDDENDSNVIICMNQSEINAALRTKVSEEFDAGLDKPAVTISVDMIQLAKTEQYKDVAALETVSPGDTVHCINSRLGITTDARVIEMTYDAVRDCVSSVVLGDYANTYTGQLEKDMRVYDQIRKIQNTDGTVKAESISGFINGAMAQLKAQYNAADHTDHIAILFENKDATSPTYGALAIGTQGLMISRDMDGAGNWNWTTAMTAKGLVTDIIVGHLISASKLTGSISNGSWKLDFDNGTFSIGDISAGKITSGTIDTARLNVHGIITAGSIATSSDVASAVSGKANSTVAVSEEQTIYKSAASGTTSMSETTTWVTDVTGDQNKWTLKRPKYDSASPVLFVAKQKKTVSGTVTCTTPHIDDTTTVIDGGHIITGTINAGKISAGTITAAVVAKNLTMEGGSINIETSSSSNDIISLRKGTDDWTYIRPGRVWIGDEINGTMIDIGKEFKLSYMQNGNEHERVVIDRNNAGRILLGLEEANGPTVSITGASNGAIKLGDISGTGGGVELYGSNGNISCSGNIRCQAIIFKDYDENDYRGIWDNGTNLWIGAAQAAARHHVGRTIISAGYDGDNANGYPTIQVAVPNSANDNANTYNVYHTGNLDLSGAVASIMSDKLTADRALKSTSAGNVAVSSTTATELGYVHGVTSAIQTQLNGKQATITGGASTIASSNLTASRALISNSSGKVAVSGITSTQLGYLTNTKGNIGEYKAATALSADTALTSGSSKSVLSVTLTAGVWIVTGIAVFSANTSGIRLSGITSTKDGNPAGMRTPPCASGTTIHTVSQIYSLSAAETKLYLNMYQNSGSNDVKALTSCSLRAVRIA